MNPLRSLHKKLCGYGAGMLSEMVGVVTTAKVAATGTLFSFFSPVFLLLFPFVICVSSSWGDSRSAGVPNGGAMPGVPDASSQEINPFRSIYPAAAKIVGQGDSHESTNTHVQSVFYGSGCYVAEVGEFGIVLTNWHVVSEAVGPLLVKFSRFETPGIVIMADTVWDIAAIVVYRPPFLPFPISLEVPQLGDELWVAGFGQHTDLTGYQVSSGQVLGYGRPNESSEDGNETKWNCGPDTKGTLPCETIQICTGVRYGDSGGPIINQYGELAGILWGSDGHLAMGTFCLRLQAFLTQAQFQLMHYRYSAPEFFARASRREIPLKKIAMPSVPAQNALRASGIFPISSVPVYTNALKHPPTKDLPAFYKPATVTDIDDARTTPPSREFLRIQADYKNAHKEGHTLPLSLVIPSPTLAAQRKAIGRSHPEVYIDARFAASKRKGEASSEIQATGASNVAIASTNSKKSVKYKTAGESESDFRNAGLEKAASNPKMAAQTVSEPSAEGADSGDKEKGSWREKVPGFPQISLNNVQSIVAIVVILFLFVNSLRLLSVASQDK